MIKRAFLVLLLLASTYALEAFTSFEYDDSAGRGVLLFYDFDVAASSPLVAATPPSPEEVRVRVASTDWKSVSLEQCSSISPYEKVVTLGRSQVLLKGYSCTFPIPQFAKDECAYLSFYFVGSENGERVSVSTTPTVVCSSELTYEDTIIQNIRSTGLLDINNPICFSTLLVAALFLSAFYARSGGTFASLYDFIYPKVFKPPEQRYSLRGPSPVSKIEGEKEKLKEFLKGRLSSLLGLAGSAGEWDMIMAFVRYMRGRFANLNLPYVNEGNMASLRSFMEVLQRHFDVHGSADPEAFEIYRHMKNYLMMKPGVAFIPAAKPSKFADLMDSAAKKFSNLKKSNNLFVRLAGGALIYSFKPFGLAFRGLRMSTRTAGVAGRAFLKQVGLGGLSTKRKRMLEARELKRRVSGRRGETFFARVTENVAAFAAVQGPQRHEHSFFNYLAALDKNLSLMEESIKRTLFFEIIAANMSEDARRELRGLLLAMGHASSIGDLESMRDRAKGLISSSFQSTYFELEGALNALQSLSLRDRASMEHLARELRNAGMDGFAAHLEAMASYYVDGRRDEIAHFLILNYGVNEFAAYLESTGVFRPFLGHAEFREGELYLHRFVENAYNMFEYVEGGNVSSDAIRDSLLNGLDYVVLTDVATRYGVGDAETVAAFNAALVREGPGAEGLAPHVESEAMAAAELAHAILREMMQRVSDDGFTVDTGRLMMFMKEMESGQRTYSPFDFLNDKREAKIRVRNDLEQNLGHLSDQDRERVINKATRLLDFIAVSKETKIREPQREGYRGFRWHVITQDIVEGAERNGTRAVVENGLYENLSFASAVYDASFGLTQDPIGYGLVLDSERRQIFASRMENVLNSAGIDPSNSAQLAEALAATLASKNISFATNKDLYEGVKAELAELLRRQGYSGKEISSILKSMDRPLRSNFSNFVEEHSIPVLTAFEARNINLQKSFYFVDSNSTQEAGFDGMVFTRDVFIHGLLFAERLLGPEAANMNESERLEAMFSTLLELGSPGAGGGQQPRIALTDDAIDALKQEGIYFIRTESGMYMPMLSDNIRGDGSTPERTRAAEVMRMIARNATSGKGDASRRAQETVNTLADTIRTYSLNSFLKNLPPNYAVVGLERIALLYKEGGSLNLKHFIELPPATMDEIVMAYEKIKDDPTYRNDNRLNSLRELVDFLVARTNSNDPRLTSAEAMRARREQFEDAIRLLSEIVRNQSADYAPDPTLAARIARSYMETTRDPYLFFSAVPEAVHGSKETLRRIFMSHYREMNNSRQGNSSGIRELFGAKLSYLSFLMKESARSARDFFVSSVSDMHNYIFPSRGMEFISLHNEISKEGVLDTLEYVEKRRADLLKDLTQATGERRRELEREIKSLEEVKSHAETYLTRYSYYFGRDKYYIYAGLSGSKESTLATAGPFRGIYVGTNLLHPIMDIQGKATIGEHVFGKPLAGYYTQVLKMVSMGAEVFRKPAVLAQKASQRAAGLPGGTDLVMELYDARLRAMLEERYGRTATGISPYVFKAKDSYDHWTKSKVEAREALLFREMLTHTLGFGLVPGAVVLASTVAGLAGAALVGATAVTIASSPKLRKFASSSVERLLKGVNNEELRQFLTFDDMNWRVSVGKLRHAWLSREVGPVMGAGAKGIPGMSYHFATTHEYTPAPSLYEAYRAITPQLERSFGGGVLGFVPSPRTIYGGTRFTFSLVNKLELQYKELEGYGPSYNFSYGLISPAFLINFAGALLKTAYLQEEYAERSRFIEEYLEARREGRGPPKPSETRFFLAGMKGVAKGLLTGAFTTAVASYAPLPGLVNAGSAMLSLRTAKQGYQIKCSRCGEMKRRGSVCPHCGFRPAYGSI